MKVSQCINNMKNPVITSDEVRKQLIKLIIGKSPDPDDLKPELYKHLLENYEIINKLTIILLKKVIYQKNGNHLKQLFFN